MTTPCVDPNYYTVPGGVLTPNIFLQWQHRAHAEIAPVTLTLTDVAAVSMQAVEATWTNTTPLPQQVFALCTRGTSRIVVTGAKRFYMEMRQGITTNGAVPTVVAVSAHGGGLDLGVVTGTTPRFSVWEDRQPMRTAPFVPNNGGVAVLPNAGVIRARVEIFAVRELFGNPTAVAWNNEIELQANSGVTMVDIYSSPVIP